MGDAFTQYKMGLNHAPAYTVSGIPFVTGNITAGSSSATPVRIDFPFVTQRILVHNGDKNYDLKVGFSANGVKNSNYFICDGNGSNNSSAVLELRVKCTSIFLIGADATHNTSPICISAEMTGIPASEYDLKTAYSGSVGIG